MVVPWDRMNQALEAGFGESATYTPPSGVAVAVPVIFDAAHHMVDLGGEEPISTTGPVADVRLSAVPDGVELDQGGTLTYAGAVYRIDDVQPSGTGAARLILTKKATQP